MPATPLTTTPLDHLFAALATGEAQAAIEDARDDAYPVNVDPAFGVVRISEDN